jgi:hypothetical protein
MNCPEFLPLAGDVLEGERHAEAEAHLAACPRCRQLVGELGAIERQAFLLPPLQPSPELWTRLEAAALAEGLWYKPQGLGAVWRWLGFDPAAAEAFLPMRPAFAVLTVSVLLAGAMLLNIPAADSPLASRAVNRYEVAQAELVLDTDYATRYQLHLSGIESRLLSASSEREPEMRELVARPLETVDRAIEETQAQLSAYPDDTLARDELIRLYRQKAVVLQAMADPAWYEDAR